MLQSSFPPWCKNPLYSWVFLTDITRDPAPTTCIVNTVTWLLVPLSPNAIVTWELVIAQELMPFKSSRLSQLLPRIAGDPSSSKCMILRSSFHFLQECKRSKDLCLRLTDLIHSSCNLFICLRDGNKFIIQISNALDFVLLMVFYTNCKFDRKYDRIKN